MRYILETTDNGYILRDMARKSELILWVDINQAWYLESGKLKRKIDSAEAMELIADFKWLVAGKIRRK